MQLRAIKGVRLLATATAFPPDVAADALCLDNAGVLAALGCADPAPLLSRAACWGVAKRAWLQGPGAPLAAVDVVDLAEAAARRALDQAGVAASEVDALFLATSTPARISSSAAAQLARRLGVSGMSVELRGGGAGALQGLALAAASSAHRALVVAAEVLSATLDPNDLASALLYADGAGAVVLGRDPGHAGGLAGAQLGTAAVPGRPFTIPGRLPPVQAELDAGRYVFQQPDRAYLDALGAVWDATADRLKSMVTADAVIAPYPVTRPLAARLAERLGVPFDQLAFPLAAHGCVGSAGVLVALDAARRQHPERPVGLIAVGGGVTWGAMSWVP